MDNYIMNDNIL